MSTLERIQAGLNGITFKVVSSREGTTTIEIAIGDAKETIRRLRDACGFETNTFVTAVDRQPKTPRFELAWQFLSYKHNDYVRVHAAVEASHPHAPTITDLFAGTAYSERECFDMFGIVFDGHVGLKRLLMPEDYDHFPLRKDFPHQGIEPDRLYREWDRRRRERQPLAEESES
ncbi:MAG: NADH-quinone oxidoreductase subunit C [Planctomycetota bacterium]|nr:NADH-quinone oxidoreductase subunit C [Planctomycetota bacterium]